MSETKKREGGRANTIWDEFKPIPFIETLPTKESIITIQNECSLGFVPLLTNNCSKTQYFS
jgi:hypothetical protein